MRRILQKSRFVNSKGLFFRLPAKMRKLVKTVKFEMRVEIPVPEETRRNIIKFKGIDMCAISRKRVDRTVEQFDSLEKIDQVVNDMVQLYFNYKENMVRQLGRASFCAELDKELEQLIEEHYELSQFFTEESNVGKFSYREP